MAELSTLLGATLSIADGSLDTVTNAATVQAALTAHTGSANPHSGSAAVADLEALETVVGGLASDIVGLETDVATAQAAANAAQSTADSKVASALLGVISGVATLGADQKLTQAQRPVITAADISDSTVAGRSMLTAANAAAQLALLLQQPSLIQPAFPGTFTASANISGRVYLTYMGYFPPGWVLNYINRAINTNGAGTQTDEVALYSSVAGPSYTPPDLTRLAYSTSTDDVTTGATPRRNKNTGSLAVTLAGWTHIWCVCRTVMGTTQVTFRVAMEAAGALAGFFLRSTNDTLGTLANLPTLSGASFQVSTTAHPHMSISVT